MMVESGLGADVWLFIAWITPGPAIDGRGGRCRVEASLQSGEIDGMVLVSESMKAGRAN